MGVRIKLRRDTAANWQSTNPILQIAEPGYDTNAKKFKIGDGITPWNNLAYQDKSTQTLTTGFDTPLAGSGSNGDLYNKITNDEVTFYQKVNGAWVERGGFEFAERGNVIIKTGTDIVDGYIQLTTEEAASIPAFPVLATYVSEGELGTYATSYDPFTKKVWGLEPLGDVIIRLVFR